MSLDSFSACINSETNNPCIVIRDKKGKSKYCIHNPNSKQIIIYIVDGCIDLTGKRCDYLILVKSDLKAILLELKGSHLLKAIKQISQTLEFLLCHLDGYHISGRIVLTKVHSPNLQTVDYIRLKKRFRKLGGDLRQESNNIMNETL